MTTRKRNSFSSDFNTKVVLEVIQGVKTLNEIDQEFGGHPVRNGICEKELQEQVSGLFDPKRGPKSVEATANPGNLHTEFCRLKVELDWFKHKSGFSL